MNNRASSEAGFVDIRLADTRLNPAQLDGLSAILSEQELIKAEQTRNGDIRRRYLATRGLLRQTLATYLDVAPQHLVFLATPHGKPYIQQCGITFNVSHSGDRLAIAVGNIGELGIDIERHAGRENLPDLVRRCFADSEIDYWQALPVSQQPEAFYRFWTRKEAFVKAVGRGLALGLNRCVIDCSESGRFAELPRQFGSTAEWRTMSLPIGDGFSGALVCAARPARIRLCWLGDDLPEESKRWQILC